MQRQDDDNDVGQPHQHTDDAVSQREIDLVVADGLAVVLSHEEGVTTLLPDGVQGAVDVAEHEEQANQDKDAVERKPEGIDAAVIDKLHEVVVVDAVVQILEVEHVECQMEAEGDRQQTYHGEYHFLDQIIEPGGPEHQRLFAWTRDEGDAGAVILDAWFHPLIPILDNQMEYGEEGVDGRQLEIPPD